MNSNTFDSSFSIIMEEGREDNIPTSSRSQPTSSTHPPLHQLTLTSRRNEPRAWPRRQLIQTSHLLFFIFLICCFSISSASSIYIEESMVEVQAQESRQSQSELLKSAQDRLARTGTILVDPRPPPNPKSWTLATEHDDLQRRSFDDLPNNVHRRAGSLHSSSSMISTAPAPSSTTPTGTSSGITAATEAPAPLPSPFDQGFAGNITDSCNTFMYGILTNATFKACLPFSLLLQGSTSFFQASKSIVKITQTLDATCAANLETCAPLMASLASNMTAAANCASDLSTDNPLIQQAHLGLLAYKPLYTASCLRNPSTSSYCFADAVTNASSPTDSYIYYLPLNISLPGGSQPTCSSCLVDTMAVFESASSDRSSALAYDYVNAATLINLQCGPGFVNQSLAPPIANAASIPPSGLSSNVGVIALAVLVGSWLL